MAVVVIGGGQAAGQLVASLRQEGYEDRITIICEEPHLPYQRPPLSKQYLKGEVPADKVPLRPRAFYEAKQIKVLEDQRVMGFDSKQQKVICNNGSDLPYDDLVLATGSKPIPLSVPGADLKNVHLFRTLDDVDAIRAQLNDPRKIAIVGGGYIGLEVAASCQLLGHQVTVIELEDRVLKRVATPMMSKFYQDLHTERGVTLHLNKKVEQILSDDSGSVSSIKLTDGEIIDADIVIVGIGIRPVTNLAEEQNLEVNNGIFVDEHCRTKSPHVYAIGDCTNHPNPLLDQRIRLECVPNAMEQARVAAQNIAGKDTTYASYPWFWSDQYELKLQMTGLLHNHDDVVIRGSMENNTFSVFYLRQGKLISADAVNMPRDFIAAKQLLGRNLDSSELGNPEVDLKEIIARSN